MKFIVDAQLPKSLAVLLNTKGHDAIHTLELPDKNYTTDNQITDIALHEQRVVITKDNDFLESFLLYSRPKKLILVKTGNIRNQDLISIFDNHIEAIILSIHQSALIEIYQNEIVVHS